MTAKREADHRTEAGENQIIAERLAKLAASDTILFHPSLSLSSLAARIGIPDYRLSLYFNKTLKTGFPAWLNRNRIDWVCGRMAVDADAKILDLAFEAGYRSKTTFNTQFKNLKKVTPTEYRRSLEVPKDGK